MGREGLKAVDRKENETKREGIRCRCGRLAIVRLGQQSWVCEKHAFNTKLKEAS